MSLEEVWIFQENLSVLELTTNLSIAILSYFPQQKDSHVVRNIFVEQINKNGPWNFLTEPPKTKFTKVEQIFICLKQNTLIFKWVLEAELIIFSKFLL